MTKSFFGEPNIEDWKKLSPKDGALRFIEFMETVARNSLSDKALGPEEKKTLAEAMEGLRPAFGLLNASMGVQADAAYTALWWIMGHSFAIGQHDGFLDKRAKKVFHDVQQRSGSAANATKAQALDCAIIAEVKANGKMSRSIEYARRIRPGVIRRLGLNPKSKYPSEVAIKSHLLKIKIG